MAATIGEKFNGAIVVSIDEEVEERPNGKIYIRQHVTLDNGFQFNQEVFKDISPQVIEGEYVELEYQEFDSPKGITLVEEEKATKRRERKEAIRAKLQTDLPSNERHLVEVGEKVQNVIETCEFEKNEEQKQEEVEAIVDEQTEDDNLGEIEPFVHATTEVSEDTPEIEMAVQAEEQQNIEIEKGYDTLRNLRKEDDDEAIRRSKEALAKRKKQMEERHEEQDLKRKQKIVVQSPSNDKEPEKLNWARVYCKAKAPEIFEVQDWIIGVWSFVAGHDKDRDWIPQDVLLYDSLPEDFDTTTPHGAYGLAAGTKPDDKGKCDPKDVLFFMPGEAPPENGSWTSCGVWTLPTNTSFWPPRSEKTSKKDEPTAEPTLEDTSRELHWARVFSKTTVPETVDEVDWMIGVWSYREVLGRAEGCDDSDWIPQDVIIYENDTISEDFDYSSIHGHYGFAPSTEANQDGKDVKPMDCWFFGPGEVPPNENEWCQLGIWALPDNGSWPPPSKVFMTEKNAVPLSPANDGLLEANQQVARVFPRAKVPTKREKGWLLGVWSFGNLSDGNKDHDSWDPQEVVVYEDSLPENFDNNIPHGQYGLANNAEQDENGDWGPCDVLFLGPDETTSADLEWQPLGFWALSSQSDWPPPSEEPLATNDTEESFNTGNPNDQQWMRVYPRAKAPKRVKGDGWLIGVWSYGEIMDGRNDDDWLPQDVIVHDKERPPENLDDDSALYGVYGYAAGSEPDENGNWSPQDILFYPPGESPSMDDSWKPQGYWSLPQDASWPPVDAGDKMAQKEEPNRDASPTPLPRKDAKYSPSNTKATMGDPSLTPLNSKRRRKCPYKTALVSPKSKITQVVPKLGEPCGIWRYEPNSALSGQDESKSTEEVWIYETTEQEQAPDKVFDVDNVLSYGVWGYAEDTIPDEEGNYKPEEMHFYAPNEKPSNPHFHVRGYWTYPYGMGGIRIDTYKFKFQDEELVYSRRSEVHKFDTNIKDLPFL